MVEKIVELTGTSSRSIEDAVQMALSRASVTVAGIRRAEITSTTALVEDGKVNGWKVELRVAFEIRDRIHE